VAEEEPDKEELELEQPAKRLRAHPAAGQTSALASADVAAPGAGALAIESARDAVGTAGQEELTADVANVAVPAAPVPAVTKRRKVRCTKAFRPHKSDM
jgi:hypothetical protein